jgi:hypothetical protein
MKTSSTVVVSLVLLAALALTRVPSSALSSGPGPTTPILVEDIGTKVTLVGRLGVPLGKMMEVRGTWAYPKGLVKDFSLRFTVTHVNGKSLPSPVEFDVGLVRAVMPDRKDAIPKYEDHKRLAGSSWMLRAYETGRFYPIPMDYWRELGDETSMQPPYWTKTFVSELVGVVRG